MESSKQKMIRGIGWSAIEKYSGLVVSILVSMILARLLSPSDYGTIAIATVIISFLSIVGTMGIAPAIIQRRDLTKGDLDNIYTFTLFVGLIFSVVFCSISWPIAKLYHDTQLSYVCQLLTISLFFGIANMVPNALMAKNQKFKQIALRTLALQLISGTIAVIAAWKGLGVYSLLVSPIVSSIGIFLYNRKFFRLHISKNFTIEPIRRIFSYTSYTFAFDFINFFTRNLDKIIIGKYISMDNLGLYEKSYRLMQLPIQNVTAVINPVIQPIFSEFQDDKKDIAAKYNRIIRFIGTISFPLGVCLSFCGYEVIHIFYGGKWDGAVETFKILSLSLPLQMVLSTVGFIYQSSNAPKYLFLTGTFNMIMTVVGFILSCSLWGTIEAVAWSWTITLFLGFINSFITLFKIVLKCPIKSMLQQLAVPCLNAVVLAFLLWWLDKVFSYNIWISAISKCTASVVVSVVIIHLFHQYDIIQLVKDRKK